MRKCPKCGYVRKPRDNKVFNPEECPKCGTIYIKYEAHIAQELLGREAETGLREEVREAEESIYQKRCTQCGEGFDPRFFDLLPWKCPVCKGRYWDQEAQQKERGFWAYATIVGILLVALVSVGSFGAHETHKRAEIARQEQAEQLRRAKKEQETALLRAQQVQAENLRIQKERELERLNALQLERSERELAAKECLPAYEALKKIDSLMLEGANYNAYCNAMDAARQELNALAPSLDQTAQLEAIFEFYRESRDIWHIKRSRNVSKLCEKYRRIINQTKLTNELTHKEACLRGCAGLHKDTAIEKQKEFYKTVKPYVDELQQKLWMEATIFIKAYEAQWGLP